MGFSHLATASKEWLLRKTNQALRHTSCSSLEVQCVMPNCSNMSTGKLVLFDTSSKFTSGLLLCNRCYNMVSTAQIAKAHICNNMEPVKVIDLDTYTMSGDTNMTNSTLFKGTSRINKFAQEPSLSEGEIAQQSKTIYNCNITKIEVLCPTERFIRGIINTNRKDYYFRTKISLDDFTARDYISLLKAAIHQIKQRTTLNNF